MRARITLVLALALAGCATPAPESADQPDGYNRRELPASQGLFTGPDGSWTIYRNDADGAGSAPAPDAVGEAPAPEPEPSKRREILMCDGSRSCE